jgi:DNA helicase HerA-like ATPase/stalled ribosome alternative rescue factor ArfA
MPELFAKSNLMGTFKGFSEKGYEFAAEIITPYDASMLERPQLGQFILIELGDLQEASLGRITKFVPSGLLATAEGEDYINTMQRRDQAIPDDLKKDKLKYRVEIKLLGALRVAKDDKGIERIIFVPSQRRLPHLGANVSLPSNDVLKELCSLSEGNTDLGVYALGEFIYSGNVSPSNSIFRHLNPELKVRFNVNNLVSKRTVVFARAGYGKSNLIKYLISELYKDGGKNAITEKGDKAGTLIFDADGEYFWPDHKNRPGLCDVPDLRNQIVVFTNRVGKSPYYTNWKAGEVKLDIRDLPARDVIGIAISRDRQDSQNIIKLRSLSEDKWRTLVDLIYHDGLGADDDEVAKLVGYDKGVGGALAEIGAAKSNMFNVVNHLHDPQSKLISGTMTALKKGLVVVVDISLLSSKAGYNIAGLLMRKIFNYNQENFTGGSSPIPVNVVIEEAQSVLGKSLEESSPFVEWVKEGRKYDLGAILVTQQPGSMAPEILSQADNWFAFHLLSEGDASTLGKYNSHFSQDVLAHLIAEPIQGNCYMWSAPKQPFVLPVRIRNFEELYREEVVEDKYAEPIEDSPAVEIRKQTDEYLVVLVNALKEKILQAGNKLSMQEFEEEGLVGIYDGQLFFLIKEIKEARQDEQEEYVEETENALKPVLMKSLFDCDVVKRQGKKGDYYCVRKYNWEKVLGNETECNP